MKVLHFYKTSLPDTVGGVQVSIDQLCAGLSARGTDTSLLTLTTRGIRPEPFFHNGYRIHRASQDFEIASTGFSASVLPRFRTLAAAADLVHYHFPWPFMDLAHLLLPRHKPSVVTYHSDIVRQKAWKFVYGPVCRRFLTSVDRIVATSPQYASGSSVLAMHSHKVSVIPIGLDPARSSPRPELVDRWRKQFGEGFFLFVGVLRYYKGLPFLIEAAQRTGLTVLIVGTGPEEARLQRQAAGAPNIRFVGRLSEADKVALLALSGAVILPSHLRSEAFGVTLLEGALQGKPLISAEIGTGTSFVNQNGVTGLTVPPADATALGAAMDRLAKDPALARRLGDAARQRARDVFSSDHMVDAYADLYRKTIEARVRRCDC